MYSDLRSMALRMTPGDLGLSEIGEGQPFGIVMDIDVGGETATLTAFATGDASLYLSSGGGMIGGGQHPAVADAAKRFVAAGGQYLDALAPSETQPRPAAGQVNFYLLTPSVVLGATRPEQALGEQRDDLSPLFYAAQEVIGQLRLIDEGQSPARR